MYTFLSKRCRCLRRLREQTTPWIQKWECEFPGSCKRGRHPAPSTPQNSRAPFPGAADPAFLVPLLSCYRQTLFVSRCCGGTSEGSPPVQLRIHRRLPLLQVFFRIAQIVPGIAHDHFVFTFFQFPAKFSRRSHPERSRLNDCSLGNESACGNDGACANLRAI